MQHARFYNRKNEAPASIASTLSRDRPDLTPHPSRNVSRSSNTTMSSNQASLVVGAATGRSRSSSVQMGRTLNPKASDNTIVVGRYFDQKNNYDFTPKLTQNDPDKPVRDPSIPIQLTIWFHELRSSTEDFMIDLNLLPGFKIGDIVELEAVDSSKVNNHKKILFIIKELNLLHNTLSPINSGIVASTPSTPNLAAQNTVVGQIPSINSNLHETTPNNSHPPSLQGDSPLVDELEGLGPGQGQNLGPVPVQPGPTGQAGGKKNLVHVSLINNPLQRILDLLPRSLVQIKQIVDPASVEADTIEISIKNLNLSRDSMWILSSDLINSCVYSGKRITFLNNRIGFIKNIYKSGKKCFSGYVGKNTKVVYRSDGARLIFLIQTSREMWHFEESGEIMFHKLVNNLFPKIFKKWREKEAHHSITIVLFTSIDLTDIPWTSLGHGERPNKVREYFRVVVDQVNIFHWNRIMENLRLEFANFKRDIMLNRDEGGPGLGQGRDESQSQAGLNEGPVQGYSLEGTSLPSVKGNILEAINVGLSLMKDKFTDTDLKHSLNHLVVMTPGTGLFDVDYKLMLETSKKMSQSDCALDIICLSQPPLHIVPLFRFKDLTKNGKLSHCVPNWCDVSFFKDASASKDQWIPRCKIYELQMMGLMENDVHDIEIERFSRYNEGGFIEAMDSYDSEIFKPVTRLTRLLQQASLKNGPGTNVSANVSTNVSTSADIGASLRVGSGASLRAGRGPGPRPGPTSARDPLLFINGPVLNPPNVSAPVSSAVTSLGTVTNTNQEASALSTLYQIKGTGDLPKPASSRSSNASVRSLAHLVSNSGLRSLKHTGSSDKLHPKIIKKEDIFKPKDSSKLTSSNNSYTRSIDMSERERKPESIKRNKPISGPLDPEYHDELDYFWTEISNPSKELHSDALSYIKLGKWNQVFPPNIKRNLVKWRSFQSPAALPIFHPFFPSSHDLNTNYTTQIYTLLLNSENNLELDTIDDLMREMIQLRLLLGFQICDSELVKRIELEKNPGSTMELTKYFRASYVGCKIYMMLDTEIHRISNDGSTIGVQLYKRIQSPKVTPIFKALEYNSQDHQPLIRTRYADEYARSPINFIDQKPQKYNWNQFDQLLAGYDDALTEENKSFFKMKFVVMPADIPKNAFFISNESLTEEEIRVEGLRKLIAMIERGKYVSTLDEGQKKDTLASEINFYTGNLYDFLNEQAEMFDTTGNKPSNSLMMSEKLNKTVKLINLAHELQSPSGVKIVDRTWHFNTHQNCFIGNEFVTWLVGAFEDLDTREEATVYGQTLMNRGLFKHVENRHGFLDGYYFYELEQEYIDKTYRPERTLWFSRKKEKESTPGSKNNSDVESYKSPVLVPQEPERDRRDPDRRDPELRRITSLGGLNDSENSSMADSAGSKKAKKKFVLSRAVKYNADPLKKSYRPEIVTVHYDRVHNPEHCYHIRLQWLNTSTNFIDETINNWSRLCERHGLKFVETPWTELCTIPTHNPFHSFVDLKLAVNPMIDPSFAVPKILNNNKFYYHLFLLKKSGFLLDNRSAVYFLRDNIEISYSWGKPTFKYAQFIHKTGSYVVEVRDNGDFFLAPNNMHISRINAPVLAGSDFDYNLNSYTIDSQRVMLGLRRTCTSESRLRRIFEEARESWREDYLKELPSDI